MGGGLLQTGRQDIETRYSRPATYYRYEGANPGDVQKRLADAHVLIIGCGGIGTSVSYQLATAGVGHLTLCDSDVIEHSNLNRQFLYSEYDVGRAKTVVLRRELQSRNSKVQVREIPALRPEGTEELPTDVQMTVVSADTPGLWFAVNDWSVTSQVPWIGGCYVGDRVYWGPFVIPQQTGCLECAPVGREARQSTAARSKVETLTAYGTPPSTGPLNAIVGGAISNDVLKYLGRFGQPVSLNRRLSLSVSDYRLQEDDWLHSPNCPACSS